MQKKFFVFLAVVIFLFSGYLGYSFAFKKEQNFFLSKKKEKSFLSPTLNEPLTEECPLNGKLYGKSQRRLWEKRRPLGVMIENHLDSRPQSGLLSADVIYEAVAEGGITRFLAIFYCQDASYIGPIRSARVYFIDFLAEYGQYPLYAHVGGANTPGPADALGQIRQMGWVTYNDLDQFAIAFPYYWRDYERLPGVATEHTVYSSTYKLWQYAQQKRGLTDIDKEGNRWDESFEKWSFKEDSPKNPPSVKKISFDFWPNASSYKATWVYESKINAYKRFTAGQPHLDKNSNQQLTAKNIIVVFMKESVADDGYDKGEHLLYQTTGEGKALIFQDGQVIEGYWRKKDRFSRMRFYDKSNNQISLNRGQIFIEIIPLGNQVSYE